MFKTIFAAFSYFAVVFGAGFALGALRMIMVASYLGTMGAIVLEVPIMLAISWYACRSIITNFDIPATVAQGLVMGGIAFALLMAAELALSVVLLGRTIAQHLAGYADAGTMLGLAAQIAFGLFPVLQLGTPASPRRAA